MSRRPGWICSRFLSLVALCGVGSACLPEEEAESVYYVGRGSVGVIELALTQDEPVSLFEVAYSIVGHNFEETGTVDVTQGVDLRLRLGGIPEGVGYLITLTATDAADSSLVCSGSATFDVTAGQATLAAIQLDCGHDTSRGTGSLLLDGTINVCPLLQALTVTATHADVGGSFALSASAVDRDGLPQPVSYTWLSSSGELLNTMGTTADLRCTRVGLVEVRVSATDGDCGDELAAWLNCTAAGTDPSGVAGAGGSEAPPIADVRFNEIASSQAVPDGWVELVNVGTAAADLSGWVLREIYESHSVVLPQGLWIGPGEHLVLERQKDFPFSFGDSGEAQLFNATDGAMEDDFAYPAHAPGGFGRCPDGTGDFAQTAGPTKGGANACP